MNIKTTIVLAVLLVCLAALWISSDLFTSSTASGDTLGFLDEELTKESLTAIKIQHREQVQLDLKKSASGWSLPGNWPVRNNEIERLVALLSDLRSRFQPIRLNKAEAPTFTEMKDRYDADKNGTLEAAEMPSGPFKVRFSLFDRDHDNHITREEWERLQKNFETAQYGLDDPLVVKVTVKGKEHTLSLGEPADDSNRFTRPTYLRLDENDEVVRLAPGIIALLDRSAELYQKRSIFPSERLAKEDDTSGEKVEKLKAKAIAVKDAGSEYRLVRNGDQWEMIETGGKEKAGIRDRVDPEKLEAILKNVPDIWAEKFVEGKKDLDEFGLKNPEQTLTVTSENGAELTLQVGKQARMDVRKVMKPAPPFGPPKGPEFDIVHEEYRYAKLKDNNQIFEIKGDHLKDLFGSSDTLRDPKLARFKTEDARRLEIDDAGKQIVLVKKDDDWHLEKPYAKKAENSKVTELLDKLRDLEASGSDVITRGEPKDFGLAKPITVKLAVEESKGKGSKKTTTKKDFTFHIGKKDGEKDKLYVQVAGWPRINSVKDELAKLVERPALAYRNRRVLDQSSSDVTKLEVQQPGESYTLEQDKDKWELTKPVKAEIDSGEAGRLAGDLARLEAVEFVTETAAPEELDKKYGLAKPAITATLTLKDAKPTTQTLSVGGKRGDKDEYFAKLDSDPAVFVISKEVHEKLTKDSLALRPKRLWEMFAGDIAEVRIQQKDTPEVILKKDGDDWKLSGPFDAAAVADQVGAVTSKLANLSAERYVAHIGGDLTKYGLQNPYLRVSITPTADKDAKEPAKTKVLLVGNPVEKDKGKERYARLADSEAVFVLGEPVISAVDVAAVDFLNRDLLKLDAGSVEEVRIAGAAPLTLKKDKGVWQVVDSLAPAFTAEDEAVQGTLDALGKLKAERFAAYGMKVDWAAYGLEKPAATITVTTKEMGEKDKPAKETKHTIEIGQTVKESGGRYARIDEQPGVAVVAASDAAQLLRSHLDFVDRRVLTFDLDAVGEIHRTMPGKDLEIVKKGDDWHIVKPASKPADRINVETLLEKTFRLRAERVAAYPAKDLAPFGLDKPAAVATLVLPDTGKKHSIQLGKTTDEKSSERFALIDDGKAVVVLSRDLSELLTADPIRFRDHNIASFSDADKIDVLRDSRKATFARMDDEWKMTAPIAAKAENTELDELVQNLVRLRADELVAEAPKDLKIYGLEPALLRYQFSNNGKEVLDLQVGFVKGTGEERRGYAKVGNSDLVFLLAPKLTKKAFTEYRHRKIWDVDAALVDKLKFTTETGSFTLEKKDGKWEAAGKENAKVDENAVSETLDALASLKADRYVVDEAGDLPLYGLKTPALTLEVHTSTGPQVLHIGRPEGSTQRRYATRPEMNGAVFTIGETEAGKIVRSLPMFAK